MTLNLTHWRDNHALWAEFQSKGEGARQGPTLIKTPGLKIGGRTVASGELKLTRATKSYGLDARCATILQNFKRVAM